MKKMTLTVQFDPADWGVDPDDPADVASLALEFWGGGADLPDDQPMIVIEDLPDEGTEPPAEGFAIIEG